MNILHITHRIAKGRPSTVVPHLAKAQVQLGHRVSIYSIDFQINGFKPPEGVEVKIFKCYSRYEIPPGIIFTSFNKFNIVHIHDYPCPINVISALKGKPFVLQAHGSLLPDNGNWKFKLLTNVLFKFPLLDRASLVIADADLEVDQYLTNGVPSRKIRKLDLGVDLDEYSSLPARNTNGHKTILYLAKYHEIKGPDILIKAFSKIWMDDVRLVMYGWDDGYKSEVEKLVRDLGLQNKVEVNGYINGQDKIQAFVNADVWVVPSRSEMFGMGILESLACGTPIIITDRYAIANQIPRECGTVVPLDEVELANAMQTMLRYDYVKSYRDFRKSWVSKYDWKNIARETIKFYREVLVGRCLPR